MMPTPNSFGRIHFSLMDVLKLERPAWQGHGEFRYDGIHFWRGADETSVLEDRTTVPKEGWRHRFGCPCPVCRLDG